MKILEVIPFFGPTHGGSARVAYDISKCLSRNGHAITLFTSDYLLSNQWMLDLPEVKVCPFKTWVKLANFLVTPELIKKAASDVQNFDIIHMHNFRSFQNIVVAHYALKYHIPYVLQAHGSLPVIMSNQNMKILYDSFFGLKLLKGAAKVIALNEFEAKQYALMGLPTERIKIIPNGIDLSEYTKCHRSGKFRSKFNISASDKIVLYLGRINKIKGLDILAKAFAKLSNDLRDAKLVIVGPNDGYLTEFLAIIRSLGLEKNVILTGPLFGEDKFEAYADSDVYVLPSSYETFPIGLLEAYACSKPVIVSVVGNTNELVLEGVTGFLVTYGDIDQLANRIKFLLCNNDKATDLGRNGAKFVNFNFGIEKAAGQFDNLLRDIINVK
jgi:glycosyltransferase involved in cell wall biosynthesis